SVLRTGRCAISALRVSPTTKFHPIVPNFPTLIIWHLATGTARSKLTDELGIQERQRPTASYAINLGRRCSLSFRGDQNHRSRPSEPGDFSGWFEIGP